MVAYRRVTVPQFLVAAGTVLLAWAAVLLCACPASGWSTRSMVLTTGWSWPSTDHHFRGYPVPWLEYAQDRVDYVRPIELRPDPDAPRGPLWLGERKYVGMNIAVPVGMLVLAVCVPPLLVAEIRRFREWLRGHRPPLTRAARCLRVAVAAAVGGLAVALADVLTDQVEPSNGGVSEIPYNHVPAHWLWGWQPSNFGGVPGEAWLPLDHLYVIYWLRDRRAERYPVSGYDLKIVYNLEIEARGDRWTARTERTLAGMAFGALIACLVVRPWRRPAPEPEAVGPEAG